jgi:hypothetical protein
VLENQFNPKVFQVLESVSSRGTTVEGVLGTCSSVEAFYLYSHGTRRHGVQ